MDCSSALQAKNPKGSFHRKDQDCSIKPCSEKEGSTLIFTCFGSASHNSWTCCWLCTRVVCSLIINLERTFSQRGDWMINVPESCLGRNEQEGIYGMRGTGSWRLPPADRVQWKKVREQGWMHWQCQEHNWCWTKGWENVQRSLFRGGKINMEAKYKTQRRNVQLVNQASTGCLFQLLHVADDN